MERSNPYACQVGVEREAAEAAGGFLRMVFGELDLIGVTTLKTNAEKDLPGPVECLG